MTRPTVVAAYAREDEPGAWSSGEILRLLVTPVLVTLLFVGGVCWLRLQTTAGPTGPEQASIVQVHLIPRPDPADIPVVTSSQPVTTNVASLTDNQANESDRATPDDTATAPPAQMPLPVEAPAANIRPVPSSVSAPPNVATMKFQQALLRHIERYQHYPKAARLGRQQGTVDTLFSMRRDGTLVGVWVKNSSGQQVLDAEAVETIRRAQPLPAIPTGLPDQLTIQVQLAFDPS